MNAANFSVPSLPSPVLNRTKNRFPRPNTPKSLVPPLICRPPQAINGGRESRDQQGNLGTVNNLIMTWGSANCTRECDKFFGSQSPQPCPESHEKSVPPVLIPQKVRFPPLICRPPQAITNERSSFKSYQSMMRNCSTCVHVPSRSLSICVPLVLMC